MRWLVFAWLFCGCGSPSGNGGDGGDPHDPVRCSPQETMAVADEGRVHVPYPTPITYKHDPPASGPHWPLPYGRWAWGAFDETIPRESWVHNLEHGGIVLLYNCSGVSAPNYDAFMNPPDAGSWPCADVTDALRTVLAEEPPDKFGEVRILVTADEAAPKKVSAVAWDWVYQSDTVDLTALRCFRDARYGMGPEDAP